MKESPSIPAAGDPEPPVRPSYAHLSARLTALVETAGGTVTEGFPRFAPRGAMTDYDHATGSLVLHPWISPRARVEALRHEAVRRLSRQHTPHRGKQRAPEIRGEFVAAAVAAHVGLAPRERQRGKDIDLTAGEQSLVAQIIDAIEGDSSAWR